MGSLVKLIDAILFLYFLFIVVVAPALDAQTCLPAHIFPKPLVDIKTWYATEYGDYLVSEKPDFFVGIVWLELLFQWPLALASLYAISAGKSCFRTISLVYGVSTFTSMLAILAELTVSGKATDKLLMVYSPFLGFSLLAMLRGLLPHSGKTVSIGKRPALNRKKGA